MSNLSLDASIRTCKVNAENAARIESDRFLNPLNMVCIPWNGTDLTGRQVCRDSWYTMTPGCNSARQRVDVENFLRPNYSDYIGYNMSGVEGDIYGCGNVSARQDTQVADKFIESRGKLSGQYGNQWQSTNIPSCGVNSYEKAMASVAQADRQAAAAGQAWNSYKSRMTC